MIYQNCHNFSRVPSWREILVLVRDRIQMDMVVLANTCCTWAERADQRRVLGTLDERMLKDIGLTRADVVDETSKPFWRR